MRVHHFLLPAVAAAVSIAFLGCDKAEPPREGARAPAAQSAPVASMRPVQPAAPATLPAARSQLRESLPASAYAYARLPGPWVMGPPSGGAFDKAFGSAPYVEAVQRLRQGFLAKVVPDIPDEEAQFLVRLLFQHAESPIEAVLLPAPDPKSPLPELLATVQVDLRDAGALNALLAEAARHYPQLVVSEPVAADRPGRLLLAGMPALLQLDTAQSRLWLLWGTEVAPAHLTELRNRPKGEERPKMAALEAGIDGSGNGLFFWFDPPRVAQLAKALDPHGGNGAGALSGLALLQNFAFGMGSSGGINRLKLVLEMPRGGFRAYMPVIGDAPKVAAAGKPDLAMVFGLPGPSDLSSLESALMLAGGEQMKEYLAFKQAFAQKLGFGFDEIFAVLGQDISFVSDEAGRYLALHLKDPQRFHTMLDTVVQRFGLKYERRELGGHTYHHLAIPSIDALAAASIEENGDGSAKLVKRLFGVPTHLYWLEEGEYLLLAGLPQPLIDRGYVAARTPLDRWLTEQQRVDAGGSLFLVSGRTAGLPALMYQLHLEGLSYLGDMVEQPLDMFAFPTAREASVPAEGAFSVKVTSGESQLGFEMAFEDNPVEVLLTGNQMGAVATVGVLAAIAIPAYQDYTLRAEVASGIQATTQMRTVLADFAARRGRFPNADEIEAMGFTMEPSAPYAVEIAPDDGSVTITYERNELSSVVLSPERSEAGYRWVCSSDMAEKYLPKSCRE